MAAITTRVTITLFADGEVKVEGPVGDKVHLCGLLELAKHAVMGQDVKITASKAPKIEPATALPGANGHG